MRDLDSHERQKFCQILIFDRGKLCQHRLQGKKMSIPGTELDERLKTTKDALGILFQVNHESISEWEKGEYFKLFAKPSKRIQAILEVEREILIVGNVYRDQQARTLAFARQVIHEAKGRLEPKVIFVVHSDPKGNSKLKIWGRESGLTVIPLYTSNGALPTHAKSIDRADVALYRRSLSWFEEKLARLS